MNPLFDHIWYWRSRLPDRKGQACRVTARGKLNSIRVQFEDGFVVITSRFAIRRIQPLEVRTTSTTSP
jgi:hypothetical protein